MEQKVLRMGLIGLGDRSRYLAEHVYIPNPNAEIVAICDLNPEVLENGVKKITELGNPKPKTFTNYHELLALPEVDAVLVITSWETHIRIACDCMRAGKAVAFEVGGASSLEECWQLVRTHEETGVPCMLMENCCYGREELMVLNMVRNGLFGEVVHCRGGYQHDLRELVAQGRHNHSNSFRFSYATKRNCDNYPTHELGPIANVLNINRGNRMVSLVSMASKSAGITAYVKEKDPESAATMPPIIQGDIVTTLIKCATGETITISLDTSLPRNYSRGFCVRGTKAMYEGENRSLFMDGDGHDKPWRENFNNVDQMFEKYDHPLWKQYVKEGIRVGHDGIDWLMGKAFVDAVLEGKPMPIDAYDAAAWMSITCLSEQSIAMGSMPVPIPDFTCGNWMYRTPWEP